MFCWLARPFPCRGLPGRVDGSKECVAHECGGSGKKRAAWRWLYPTVSGGLSGLSDVGLALIHLTEACLRGWRLEQETHRLVTGRRRLGSLVVPCQTRVSR